jgi:hypothetical protein
MKHESEHSIQSDLIDKLPPLLRPGLFCMAIPNGGLRHPIIGKRLREEGLLPGSPDLVFPLHDGLNFWLEMKNAIGSVSDAQLGIHAKLRRLGHSVGIAKSVEEALDVLAKHGGILR